MHKLPKRLPFFGLGFDLAPLRVAASLMKLSPLRIEIPCACPVLFEAPSAHGLWGRGLQLALSREIRGR
jgi:hypothetical protein